MDSSIITRVLIGCSHWVQYRRCEPGKYREQLSVVCKCSSHGPMTTSPALIRARWPSPTVWEVTEQKEANTPRQLENEQTVLRRCGDGRCVVGAYVALSWARGTGGPRDADEQSRRGTLDRLLTTYFVLAHHLESCIEAPVYIFVCWPNASTPLLLPKRGPICRCTSASMGPLDRTVQDLTLTQGYGVLGSHVPQAALEHILCLFIFGLVPDVDHGCRSRQTLGYSTDT